MALGTNVETGAGQVELRQELTDAVDTLPPQQWAVLRGLYKTHTGGTVPRT